MKLKFLDFEVFPEWWCLVVSDQEDHYNSEPYKYRFTAEEEQTIKSKMRIYTSDNKEDILKLKQDISVGCISGYNIKGYDMIILKCILMNFTPHQLFIVSDLIIHPENARKSIEHARIATYAKCGYKGCQAIQDLMDDSVKGLKDKECSFGMDIRETTVPFDKTDLTNDEKDRIIFYCKHDVFACHVHYICASKPYVDTKLALCKTYDLSEAVGYNSTNAVLSGKVLGAERQHGTTIRDATITIYQPELKAYIEKWVPADVYEHLIARQDAMQKDMLDNKMFIADGGLHSILTTPKFGKETSKLYIEADSEWGLFNVDVSSCYPSCMIFCGAMSRAIREPDRFKQLFLRRLHLKQIPKSEWTADDKTFVPAAKLVLNTTYGAMGNEYLPLYDDYMRSKTCRIGQLILIAVAHSISSAIPELKVIQTNTDGILVYCKRSSLDILKDRVSEFEKISGFTFELEEDAKLWQLNVNNYIAQSTDGSLKAKGEAFAANIWQKGTNRVRPLGMHIIAKAITEFYVNKTNPIQYIVENTNINDMCLTCTKGGTYFALVHKTSSGDIDLGKVSRVLAVSDQRYGVVKKQKYVIKDGVSVLKEDTCAGCPDHAFIMNDALCNYTIEGPNNNRELVHNDGTRTKIDYGYYVDELERALNISWVELHHDTMTKTNKFNL